MRKITLLAVLFLIFLYGCFEKPSEPVLPTWDVDLTVPILEKTFTLGELVEKDTTYFKIGSNNQIYYSTTSELEATTVGDNLKILSTPSITPETASNAEFKESLLT